MNVVKIRSLAMAVVAGALLGGNAWAQTWQIDPSSSSLGITGKGVEGPFVGTVNRWNGKIDFDPQHPERAHIKVDADVASLFTGSKKLDEVLPQQQWLASKLFPEATFEANSVVPKGGNSYEAVGFLSIRGIRREMVLPFTLDTEGNTAHAKGTFSLVRTDYGVGDGVLGAMSAMGLEVGIVFDLTATR